MTQIVIIIDGKYHCSFDGNIQQWKHQRFFKVPNPKLQTSIVELTDLAPTLRTKQLRIFGNVHAESDMTLALFCYDMLDPTRRRLESDMHDYQIEQHRLRLSRH